MKKAKNKSNPVYRLRKEKLALEVKVVTMQQMLDDERLWHANDKASSKQTCADLIREKDRYYQEANAYRARVARLERAVTSLKEGSQKILLAFDTLA